MKIYIKFAMKSLESNFIWVLSYGSAVKWWIAVQKQGFLKITNIWFALLAAGAKEFVANKLI